MPVSYQQFAEKLSSSGLMTLEELHEFETKELSSELPTGVEYLAQQLVRRYKFTEFQADVIQQRRPDPLVVGDYFIIDEIGQGGMGVVYKARKRDSFGLVALKMMSSKTSGNAIFTDTKSPRYVSGRRPISSFR